MEEHNIMSFVLYSGNAKLSLAKLGNIKNKHVHVYWKALYTRTSTFTQKYVKYMFTWKIILSMIEAHNMMYSKLQHFQQEENSNTLKENTSKNTIPKVFLVKHNSMYY